MTDLHTPTPWGYDGDGFDSIAAQDYDCDGYTIYPLDEDGNVCGHICEMSETMGDEEAKANAAYIVKCVNCHDDLMQALKRLLHWKSYAYTACLPDYENAERILAKAFMQ